jgi:hypothetical protein
MFLYRKVNYWEYLYNMHNTGKWYLGTCQEKPKPVEMEGFSVTFLVGFCSMDAKEGVER